MPAKAKSKTGRRRLRPEQRRELIVASAVRVFAERGYDGASIAAIAKEAGISPAVIYDHFSSKATLQVELLERETRSLLGSVGRTLAAAEVGEDPARLMRVGVDAFFSYVEQNRFAWRLLFREPPSDPEVAAAYMKLDREATAGIAAFLRAGAGSALEAFPDPDRVAEMFAELLKAAQNGIAAWWYEHPEVPREQIVDRVLEFCWTGLGQIATERGK